jgi:hypothetical protein
MTYRRLTLAAFVLALSGCAGHTVHLVGRTTGATGQDTFRILNPGRDVRFALGSETYTGRWVYVDGPGTVGIGTTTGFSSTQAVTTTGTLVGLPTGGNGTFIGSSPSGASLRCSYAFSQVSLKGLGVCQDSKGETYDLQID